MRKITVAICTYNRAGRLPTLVKTLRQQKCPISSEILVVDNNSSDDTQEVLSELVQLDGMPLRFVRETKQGIVHARNRAIDESRNSAYLAFIDDDELPEPGWLNAAVDALDREGAECVGGEIRVSLPVTERPSWLEEELLPFLGEVKHSAEAFWITDRSTPVWSGNIAYRVSLFAEGLRFDHRYNRYGHAVGGGEDVIMLDSLLKQRVRIRYRPDMVIDHFIEGWKLRRSYFLKLHYELGWKTGRWGCEEYGRTLCGIPLFMIVQAIRQWRRALPMLLLSRSGRIRQAMNGAHALGMIAGRFQRWKDAQK
ncbi:MAG: glycosyltransferase family 2 protein [Proteobacteria bacterium]|nr:glycosyltransferase family 2 protein [Pseudomonadota bacterium]